MPMKLVAAPGLEISNEENELLLRLGAEYGIGIGKGFEISPGIAIEFTEDEHATVIGAVFSKKI